MKIRLVSYGRGFDSLKSSFKKILIPAFLILAAYPLVSMAMADWNCPNITISKAAINDNNGNHIGDKISVTNTDSVTETVSVHVIKKVNITSNDWEGDVPAGETKEIITINQADPTQPWSYDLGCNTIP